MRLVTVTAELDFESYLLRRWWSGGVAQWHLPIMCNALGLVANNTQTHRPTHWILVPVYTDMPSLGKRVFQMMKLNCGHRVEAVWLVSTELLSVDTEIHIWETATSMGHPATTQSYRRWEVAWSKLPCTCGGCPCQHHALSKQLWVALCPGSPRQIQCAWWL